MKNRFAIATALALLALAGCKKEPQTTPVTPATTPVSKAAPAKITQAEHFSQPMPEGVAIDFAYHARSVKSVKSKKTGATSQQFLLEYLNMDAKTASDAVSADFTRAGFVSDKGKKAKGGYNLYFKKGEYGPVKVYVRDKSPKKLHHAEAKGLIKISFPERDAAMATPASSAP